MKSLYQYINESNVKTYTFDSLTTQGRNGLENSKKINKLNQDVQNGKNIDVTIYYGNNGVINISFKSSGEGRTTIERKMKFGKELCNKIVPSNAKDYFETETTSKDAVKLALQLPKEIQVNYEKIQ